MNEQETMEQACDRICFEELGKSQTEFDDGVKYGFESGFYKGAHWQQSDPAFIADIVKQTLEYVAEKSYPVVTTKTNHLGVGKTTVHTAVNSIRTMHPEIVNQIIKRKG